MTWIVIFIIIAFVGTVFTHISIWQMHRPQKAVKAKPQPKVLNSWDDSWIEAVKAEHSVSKITEIKVDTRTEKNVDGFKWFCNCGTTNVGRTLDACAISYRIHRRDAAQKATAVLNKFEVPVSLQEWAREEIK